MPQDPLIPGYIEPDARWFLLVVGMVGTILGIYLFIEIHVLTPVVSNLVTCFACSFFLQKNSMLAVLLEAGGCAEW